MGWLSLVTENWRLKGFSLGVALLLFAFVSAENSTPTEADFRLEYRLADDMMLVNDAPLVVHTILRGPWAAFRSFDPADLEPVVLSLQEAGPGRLRHFVDLASIHPPGGMRVVSVRPAEVEVELDRRVVREVAVQADIAQAPAFGFELMEVRLVPARVRVEGPASKMQGLEYVSTRTINIHEREDDLNLEVEVRPPPPPLRLRDKRVTAFVEIGEEMSQRAFGEVPVELIGAPSGTTLSPATVTITLKGPRQRLERLPSQALSTTVDVTAETSAGSQSIVKAVVLKRPLPERSQLVGPMPKVTIEWPKKKAAKAKKVTK